MKPVDHLALLLGTAEERCQVLAYVEELPLINKVLLDPEIVERDLQLLGLFFLAHNPSPHPDVLTNKVSLRTFDSWLLKTSNSQFKTIRDFYKTKNLIAESTLHHMWQVLSDYIWHEQPHRLWPETNFPSTKYAHSRDLLIKIIQHPNYHPAWGLTIEQGFLKESPQQRFFYPLLKYLLTKSNQPEFLDYFLNKLLKKPTAKIKAFGFKHFLLNPHLTNTQLHKIAQIKLKPHLQKLLEQHANFN